MLNLKSARTRLTIAAAALGLMAVWVMSSAEDAPAGDTSSSAPGPRGNPMFGPRWGGGKGLQRMTRHLDLSDEQRTRIDEILAESRVEAKRLNDDLGIMREALHSAVTQDEYYEDQVRILIESNSPAMVNLMVLGVKTMHAVRAELTPEQRSEAEAMMDRFQRHGPRRGGSRGRHGRVGQSSQDAG